jgi:uncharacterized protein YbcV (DUF1398 family)
MQEKDMLMEVQRMVTGVERDWMTADVETVLAEAQSAQVAFQKFVNASEDLALEGLSCK